MGLFWKHKESAQKTARIDEGRSSEVEAIKLRAHNSAERADWQINRLNDLLRANGITLNISIATGGHKHVR